MNPVLQPFRGFAMSLPNLRLDVGEIVLRRPGMLTDNCSHESGSDEKRSVIHQIFMPVPYRGCNGKLRQLKCTACCRPWS